MQVLLLLIFQFALSKDPEQESACSYQVTEMLIKKSEEIQFLFKGQSQIDELGAINKMSQDSFDKCMASINSAQIKEINAKGAQEKYNSLVQFNPKDYLNGKFEPTYEFVAGLKKMQIHNPNMHKNSEL